MKRAVAAGLALTVLLFMVTASASTAGSATDPLITRSYLEGAFAEALRSEIAGSLNTSTEGVSSRIDDIRLKYIGYNFAPGFTQIELAEGSMVTLSEGGSFILLSGSASLDVTNGEVINVSTGSEVASGSQLTQYQRYFCAENSTIRVTANSDVSARVDGYYLFGSYSASASSLPFRDTPEGAWFFAAISFVYKNGLFTGTSATTFAPNSQMTRAMFVTVLHRLDELSPSDASATFSDANNPSLYYYNAVAWANANDIVTGYADGTFRPDNNVTREQMATIMYRYASYKGRDLSTPGAVFDTFPDITQISGYAAHAMRWASSWEIIRGSSGKLLPQNTATRAEVAQIIYNYCQNIEG
ncbi:MAG: S-layer homology domain-containing protein [Oscillospiraceae bacterium]|nr:S-layer homology domain-containing protein [Oscillospiraceae bacterium]